MRATLILGGLTLAGGVLGSASPVEAQPLFDACPVAASGPGDAGAPPPPTCPKDPRAVVVTGSEALEPVFRRLGPRLRSSKGIDVYYVRGSTQCLGAAQLTSGKDLGGAVAASYPESALRCCVLPVGATAHLTVSDSPIADCFDGQSPAGVRELPGPIAAYTIVVPRESPARAITREEAYFVFGFGSAGYKDETVAPWVDEGNYVLPGLEDSGPQRVWGRLIGLPRGRRLKGWQRAASAELVPEAVVGVAVTNLGKKEGIGLTTAQAFDVGKKARIAVKPLAMSARNQRYAFYPDSTPNAFDKRNVREGRYPWWAPLRVAAKVDSTGKPVHPAAADVISVLQTENGAEGTAVIDAIITAHLVPLCAMQVQRAAPGGDDADLEPYRPETACGCHMDELVVPGSAACRPCGATAPCPDGKGCSHGFCE